MKGKIKTTLLITVLLISTLAIAIPLASALPSEYLKGTATWNVNPDTSDADGLALGTRSIKLDVKAGDYYAAVELIPTSGITIDDLTALTNDWSFWYYSIDNDPTEYGPLLELRFVHPDNTDPDGAGHVDITVNTAEVGYTELDWVEEEVSSASTVIYYGNKQNGDPFSDDTGSVTIAGVEASIVVDSEYTDVSDWELVRVKVEVGWQSTERIFYIDDITIAGMTYPLEPVVLNEEDYRTGETVVVTVADIYENNRPLVTDTIEVEAASNYPDIITLTLTETGVATGIFTGTFTLVGEAPGSNDLLVDDGDTITVTYELLDVTAEIDDTPPTITPVLPEADETIDDETPLIQADLSDYPGSGMASATMKLDGEVVALTTTETTIDHLVPVFESLDEGLHTVEVTASDVAGNIATEAWSFTVDLIKPTVSVEVNPDPAKAVPVEFKLTFSETMDATLPTLKFTPVGKSPITVTGGAWDTPTYKVFTVTYSAISGSTGDGTAVISVSGAKDEAGNVMLADTSNTFVIDTTKPTKLTSLVATVTDVSVTLDWTASTDTGGTGVSKYDVKRDEGEGGTPAHIAFVTHPAITYVDYSLTEADTYTYTVTAIDLAGNEAESDPVEAVFVPGDVIATEVLLSEG
ncbi:fibronectin type III domain-containing protein, partial [Patescibacteria group bacterium]|nr:fibronectin type III domain-containing protein [Patescibacteria group bacterium]